MPNALRTIFLLAACGAAVTACASSPPMPKIVQASAGIPEVHLTKGMATQLEMPPETRVQSVTVGNPALVTAERADGIVNLMAKDGTGETNLIVRAVNDEGEAKVYQYRLTVEGP